MLTRTLEDALNQQINLEFNSAYLYLAMAAGFESADLPGFAHWMRAQSREEWDHGMRIFDHIVLRNGRVSLATLDAPPGAFESALEALQRTLEHERKVTAAINRLTAQAQQESDYPAQVLLQWFVTEQVEEEGSAGKIVHQLEVIGDDGVALLLLDKELGARE